MRKTHPIHMSSSQVLFLLLLLGGTLLFSCCKEKKTTSQTETPESTEIEFGQKHFDFGKLAEGEIVTHTFYFKNTGKENFVIKAIESGCGCTTVEYDKKPLAPGKEGKIEIAFNSSGRYGKQYKEISIFANLPKGKTTLTITADVN